MDNVPHMFEIGRKDRTDSTIPLTEVQPCCVCVCAVSYNCGKRIEQAVSIVQFYAANTSKTSDPCGASHMCPGEKKTFLTVQINMT